MDFDRVEFVNLDRLHATSHLDALLRRPKIDVARRILRQASTAGKPQHDLFEESICEPAGLEALLDFDVIFSCVDRPWPRHVLNTIAYSDLIPVVDGACAWTLFPAEDCGTPSGGRRWSHTGGRAWFASGSTIRRTSSSSAMAVSTIPPTSPGCPQRARSEPTRTFPRSRSPRLPRS